MYEKMKLQIIFQK